MLIEKKQIKLVVLVPCDRFHNTTNAIQFNTTYTAP